MTCSAKFLFYICFANPNLFMRYLIFMFMAVPCCLFAQTLSRQSLHSLGGSMHGVNLTLQHTVGQSSNFSVFTQDQLSLRQGFLHGYADDNLAANQHNALLIFPNPNHGYFTLQTALPVSGELQVMVFNAFGQVVPQFDCPAQSAASISLSLPTGLYFIRAVLPSKQILHSRFIVAL